MNFILRPAFNRPEMLYLSIKAEEEARKYFCNSNYETLFCVEHGAPPIITEIIKRFYPFKHGIVYRKTKHYGWGNILEGFNLLANLEGSYILNIEDDCVIHKTYFKYMDKVLSMVDNKCSAINASNRSDSNRDQLAVEFVKKTNRFEATCCLIFTDFYNKYVRPYATYEYYRNRAKIISEVNKRNGDNPKSKYRPSRNNLLTHVGWDGLVNRLVDAAAIEEDMYCISPEVDRRIHIGFYGQNRPGKFSCAEQDFFKRVEVLKNIVTNPATMNNMGMYKDYENFSEQLETWSGNLIMK